MHTFLPTGDENLAAPGEAAEPVPAPNQALVRVEAFSLNLADVVWLSQPATTWVTGYDVAGVVAAAAADGSGPAEGTRVVGILPGGGAAAQLAAVATDSLTALPDGIDAVRAAALPLAGLTALRLVRTAGELAGRRVLATGMGGGVGSYLVELAVAAGAEITAVSAQGHERLRALGAAQTVPSVGDASGLFDVVLDSVGGPVLAAALALTRPGGLAIWYGQAGGEPMALNFFDFVMGPIGASVRHFAWFTAGGAPAEDLAALVDLVDSGRLHVDPAEVRDWSETPALLRDLRDRKIRGKAVLTVSR